MINIEKIKGICPIIATPFTASDEVDYDSMRNLIRVLGRGGCHALTLFGIAGEYYKLNESESLAMVRLTVEECRAAGVPSIISVTAHSTAKAVEMAKRYEAEGADCLMLLPPFFLKPSGEELYQHILRVAQSVSLPVMLQYAPEQTGVAIAPSVFVRLSNEAPNVVYYKIECKPSGGYISTLIANTGGSVRVFVGNAGYQLIEALDRGAVGAMPGCSMFDVYLAAYDRYMAGDRRGAMELHNSLLPILNHIRQNVEMIIYFEKRILKRRGIIECDSCRTPSFATDKYFDALFEEYYAQISEKFTV